MTNEILYISTWTRSLARKYGKVETFRDWLPPINSHKLLNMWSRNKSRTLYLHYHNAYGLQTYQDDELPWGELPYKITWFISDVILWDHVTNQKHHIFNSTMIKVTKFGKVLTYDESVFTDNAIWSFNHFEVTRKTKNITSPTLQGLWPQNFAVWSFTMKYLYPESHVTHWFRDHVTN